MNDQELYVLFVQFLFISNHVAPQRPHVTFYLQVLESHAVPPSLRRPLHRSADDDTAFCRGLQRARAGLLGADGHSAWNHPVFSSKNAGILLIYGVHHFLQPGDPGKPMETWVFSPPCSRVAWSLLLLGPGDAHQSRDLPHAAPRTAYDHFLCH